MSILFTILAWVITPLIGFLLGLVLYARWNYGILERLGIPVITPFLFLGSNYKEHCVDVANEDVQRQKKYGSVYGVYDGRTPLIFISDPNLIRLISTVDFDHFRNHGWEFGFESTSIFGNILDLINDEKWKTVRGALTPIFTGGKIKQLKTIIQNVGEDYVETLLKQCSETSDGRVSGIRFREFVAPMMIEILAKCFCGIEIPNARDENNEFVQNMKLALLHNLQLDSWKTVIPKVFPFMNYFLPSFSMDGLDFFVSTLKTVLAERETSGHVSIDATSTLVDMMKKVRTDPIYKNLGINETVVLAQGWEFFTAGYAGNRDTFDFFMYEMATNESIQEKVYQEILSGRKVKGHEFNFDEISQMPYLNACVLETLRLHLSFVRPERLCNKDWKTEGLFIPKGMQITFATAAVHRNPEFYPNPDTFDPTRFMPGNKEGRDPYTFLAFGQGPRGCIGQRFTIEMLKVLLVTFLLRFKIKSRKDTICETYPGGSFILQFKPLLVDVIKR